MKKLLATFVLLLTGCTTYIPPEQISQQEAYRLCSNLFPPSEKRTEKQNEEFNKCRVEKYTTLLPAYTQQAQARQMQMQTAIQNLGNSIQKEQQQDLENQVWAANPEFAACKYRGICNQNRNIHTTCRHVSNTIQCDSY